MQWVHGWEFIEEIAKAKVTQTKVTGSSQKMQKSHLFHVLFGNIGLALCQGLESTFYVITGLDVL